MKKLFRIAMSFALAAVALTACQKEIEQPNDLEQVKVSSHISFYAEAGDPATRATLTTTDEKSFKAAWEETDQVSLYAYDGTFEETQPATWDPEKGCFDAEFETTVPTEPGAWMYEAKYPYTTDGNIPFGTARVQNGNAYNSAYDVMYGTVDYDNALLGKDNNGNVFVIPMNRLTGIAYFHITGGPEEDVVSATLEATGIAAETVTIASNGKSVNANTPVDAITITFKEGTAPKASDHLQLWFNVLPGSYSGLKLTINTATKTAVLNSNKQLTYTAGKLNKAVLSGLTWDGKASVENFSSSKATDDNYNCNSSLNTEANRSDFDYTWTPSGSGTVFKNGIKLGGGSATGSVTSEDILSSIESNSTFTVKVYAAVWNNDGGQIVATYNGLDITKDAANDPITATTGEYDAEDFSEATEFVFTKVENGGGLTIASSSKRILIDKVEILPGGEVEKYLTVSPESQELEADETSASFNITTNGAWTASIDAELYPDAEISSASGTGDATVTVSFPENETSDAVTAAVVTVSVGTLTKTVTFTQKAHVATIEDKSIAEFIEAADEETNYRLTGTVTSAISTGANFNRFILTDATGSITVYNLDDVSQFVEGDIVTLYGKYELYNSTHEVVSGVYESHVTTPKLNVSSATLSATDEATSASFTITASEGVEWSVASNNEAITLSPSSGTGTASAQTVTLSFAANTATSEVTSTITVSSTTENCYKNREILFTQAAAITGKPVTFSVPTSQQFTYNGSTKTLSLSYNGITITQAAPSGTAVNSNNNTTSTLRVYQGNTLSFAGGNNYITSIKFTHSGNYSGATISPSVGSYNASTETWTGKSQNVVLTMGSQLRPTTITITYLDPNATVEDPTLNVDEDFELIVGKTKQLTVTTNSDGAVSYSSSNTSIATVSETGLVTAVATGEATITVNIAKAEWYNAASKSVAVSVIANSLQAITLSGQTMSFKVGDAFSFDGTVTATYKDGTTNVIPSGYIVNDENVDMTKEGSFTVTVSYTENGVTVTSNPYTVTVTSTGGPSYTTDVLNRAVTGVTGTSYTDWSGKSVSSTAVYAGNSAGGNESIQLRSKNNNSGFVSTTSGGKITKVVVAWNSNTLDGRTIQIYGSNTAYNAASDLYNTSTQGTLLGTIVKGTSTELEIESSYSYIGIRSAADALYLSSVSITWAK